MPKILIVGCGLTGAATYHYLCGLHPHLKSSIQIWEAASSIGGRMSTDRCLQSFSSCDLGAQYITKNTEMFDDTYHFLSSTNTLVKLRDNAVVDGMRPEHLVKTHFIAPQGTSSIVGSLAQGANLHLGKKLLSLNYDSINRKVLATGVRRINTSGGWPANAASSNLFNITASSTDATHETEEFDAVVLGILAPQILSLEGNFLDSVDSVDTTEKKLSAVSNSDHTYNNTASGNTTSETTADNEVVNGSSRVNIRDALSNVRYSSRYVVPLIVLKCSFAPFCFLCHATLDMCCCLMCLCTTGSRWPFTTS